MEAPTDFSILRSFFLNGSENMDKGKIRGADAIANALKAEGVEFVTGITGGSTWTIFDALHSVNIRILVCRHERGAADIADGYARITGKPLI